MESVPVLSDITNIPTRVVRKRRSDGTVKLFNYARKPRVTLDCQFQDESSKMAFQGKLEKVRTMSGATSTQKLITQLLDVYLTYTTGTTEVTSPPMEQSDPLEAFICSKSQLMTLIDAIKEGLHASDFSRHGHVGIVSLKDERSGQFLRWSSSPTLQKDYAINYKMAHAYLCSGMLPIQYDRLCEFANIGMCSRHFRQQVSGPYSQTVTKLKQLSIDNALQEEINATQDNNGISILSDARHACRKNSYHSDIISLGHKTHKVINHQHVTKHDERSSQKHELFGTIRMYQEMEGKNIKINVHSHDRNTSVSKYITQNHPLVQESYDTWHAAKEVRKHTSKIVRGPRRSCGETWHPQLADKATGIKTHTYWCMKNCDGSPDQLQQSLDNIVHHYQHQHDKCDATSRCKHQLGYVPSRLIITEPKAVELLQKCIHSLQIYKQPHKYMYCIDTHYVESFNNVALIYVDKRVHYHDTMYGLRMGLAVLNWNEHVDRPASSLQMYMRAKNPNQQSCTRVLKPKTNRFVDDIWKEFYRLLSGKQDLAPYYPGDDNIEDISIDEDIIEEISLEDSFVTT